MRQKKKLPARKPAASAPSQTRQTRNRNAWEPQVVVPHQVDLPLPREEREEVVVPAAPNGRSLADGRF